VPPGIAPRLGEHTAQVLADVLGAGPATIEQWRGDGMIGGHR
jgi:hypothetical protein